jgi:hypothetical protein
LAAKFSHITAEMSFAHPGSSAPQSNLETDVRNFERRLITLREIKDKINNSTHRRTCSRTMGELDSAAEAIRGKLQTADPSLRDQFQLYWQEYSRLRGPLSVNIASLNEQERAAALPSSERAPNVGSSQLQQNLLSPEHMEAQQQADHLDYVQGQAQEIIETLQAINQTAHEIDTTINDQHVTLIKVDGEIGGAVTDMVSGNEQLEVAEKHQKSAGKCIIWVLVAAIAGVVVLGLIIGLSVGLKKKSPS